MISFWGACAACSSAFFASATARLGRLALTGGLIALRTVFVTFAATFDLLPALAATAFTAGLVAALTGGFFPTTEVGFFTLAALVDALTAGAFLTTLAGALADAFAAGLALVSRIVAFVATGAGFVAAFLATVLAGVATTFATLVATLLVTTFAAGLATGVGTGLAAAFLATTGAGLTDAALFGVAMLLVGGIGVGATAASIGVVARRRKRFAPKAGVGVTGVDEAMMTLSQIVGDMPGWWPGVAVVLFRAASS